MTRLPPFRSLRQAVCWKAYDLESIGIGLKVTLFCAYEGEKIVGMGRVIGDGRLRNDPVCKALIVSRPIPQAFRDNPWAELP